MRRSSSASLMEGWMVSALSMVEGGGRQTRTGRPLQIAALQVGPRQSRHKGIAAAGGTDHLRLGGGQGHAAALIGGIDAVGSQ